MIPKSSVVSLALLALQIVVTTGFNISTEYKFAIEAISNEINQFSPELYGAIAENKDGNIVFSPMSVWTVLSMASNGAKGSTAMQLRTTLHQYFDQSFQGLGIEYLLRKLNALEKVQLKLANKIFIANNLNLNLNFEKMTENIYKSSTQAVDFSQSVETSEIINSWVEDHTNSRIRGIVNPDDLNEYTGLILINAVYFKGRWANQFQVTETSPEPFYLQDGTIKNVPMMRKIGTYKVGSLPEMSAQFIELPYESEGDWDSISMFVIVPNTRADFQKVEKNMKNLHISRFISGTNTEVDLFLPKFKVESEIDLKSPLVKLGLIDIFEDSANFSGIVDSPLKVSKVIQKAFIEVNEEGSEAVAVTDIEVENRFGWDEVPFKVIHVNHPFLLVICTQDIGLFSARVVDPNF